jgi:hypothetical protein
MAHMPYCVLIVAVLIKFTENLRHAPNNVGTRGSQSTDEETTTTRSTESYIGLGSACLTQPLQSHSMGRRTPNLNFTLVATGTWKSDLRNHCATVTVQPRLYSCAMVTQITLKTEGPPGLPSDARLRRLIRSAPLEVLSAGFRRPAASELASDPSVWLPAGRSALAGHVAWERGNRALSANIA